MSDSEQCLNRLELDLISLLVNFSCELGPIMTRYDFLWARWVILSNVRTDSQLNLILLVNFSCELGQIILRYDLLPGGCTSDSEQCSNWLQLYLISILVNFSCELGQMGGSFKKKVQSGATNLIRFYISLNWAEKWFLPSK